MSDDDMPELHHENGYIDSDEDADDWEEMEQELIEVQCLFCVQIHKSVEEALDHLKTTHNFDISELKNKHGLDQYMYIKLINYIRRNRPQPEDVLGEKTCVLWDMDEYLKPSADGDISWLTFDIESIRGTNNNEQKTVTIPIDEYQEMKSRIEELEQLLHLTRSNFRSLLEKDIIPDPYLPDKKREHKDEEYFNTYSHFGIHYDMLSDEVRTSSYRRAIMENTDIIEGKIVLDVGCGTSILSMFASQAGAKQVLAVDQSDIIYQAMDIAERNNIRNIKFIKGRLEDVPLEIDQVDIIVSEWMGYFLMFEGMLDSVIYARKNYLRPGGFLLPNRCNISVVGYGDRDRHTHFVRFWENVYGFDMLNLQRECLKEVSVESCRPDYILTDSNVICDLDLMTVDLDYSNFDYSFNLKVLKDGTLTSLVGYFDTFFELPTKPVMFSTSPESQCTHWKQVVFYFKETFDVKQGQSVTGKFICRRGRKDIRGLNITIKLFDHTFNYMLD